MDGSVSRLCCPLTTRKRDNCQEGHGDVYQELDGSQDAVLGCRFSGTVTDDEFKEFVSRAKRLIAAHHKIRLLILMDYPQDFDLRAAWDDVVFWARHIWEIERLAIVGQSAWQKWMESMERFLLHAQIRYYDASDLAEAWSWLKEDVPLQACRT
jgi:hypothetical protein